MKEQDDTLFGCTVCGRVGTVGRCCGLYTRKPLNERANFEIEKEKAKMCVSPAATEVFFKREEKVARWKEEHKLNYVAKCCGARLLTGLLRLQNWLTQSRRGRSSE